MCENFSIAYFTPNVCFCCVVFLTCGCNCIDATVKSSSLLMHHLFGSMHFPDSRLKESKHCVHSSILSAKPFTFVFLCFCTFSKKSQKFKMTAIFLNFCQKSAQHIPQISWRLKIFDEIALSLTVKEIEAILCFRISSKKSKIQNGRHF